MRASAQRVGDIDPTVMRQVAAAMAHEVRQWGAGKQGGDPWSFMCEGQGWRVFGSMVGSDLPADAKDTIFSAMSESIR